MRGVRSELYVFGVTGVGKTYTVKAVLKHAPKEWADKFQYAWVNCKNIRPLSGTQIMKEISTQLGMSWKSGGRGISEKDITEYVIQCSVQKPLLVVFDEVDAFVKADRTYLLYTFLEHKISLILISNVFDWPNADNVDMRIKSRSKTNRVEFGAYSRDEMLGILGFHAEKGVKDGTISDKILEKIAEQTYDYLAGDVRKGKFLMSASVDEAEKEGVDKVSEEHLVKAYQKVQPMSLKNILKNFSLPELVALAGFVLQRLSYESVQEAKRATTENVHKYYEKCAKLNGLEPVKRPMMKLYLQRLEESGILDHQDTHHEKSRGRTNVYYSDYDIMELGWALTELGIKFPKVGGLDEFGGAEHEYFDPSKKGERPHF